MMNLNIVTNKKNTASYYTPKILSDFLASHITKKYLNHSSLSILEPSCGDGQFVSSLFNSLNFSHNNHCSIDLIDIDKKELAQAVQRVPKNKSIYVNAYTQDYLQFFLNSDKKYSLVIGNPPYINKKNMKKAHINRCERVHKRIKAYSKQVQSNFSIKNSWPAFVQASIMSLEEYGVLCLVIPAEILQVKYTRELRSLIRSEFDRIEIFAFNELIFEGIQQDVVALIGVKGIKNKKEHGFSFYQVESLKDLKEPRFTEKYCNIHRTSLDKWTNYILSDDELNFIEQLKKSYNPIKSYCKQAEVGIVSAANDYFMLNDNELKQHGFDPLKSMVKPILPKGYFLSGLANLTHYDFDILRKKQRKVNFLYFPDVAKNKLGKIAHKYLQISENLELHKRYKMVRRKNWYHVPSIWASEGLFIKRCHLYPKLFVNEINALATDSFYRVVTDDKYSIKNLVFSFYNSMTFVLAELEGRFYGGGVLELTPNEFKNLSIPYNKHITNEQFDTLDQMLRESFSLDLILSYTNSILFKDVDINQLETIRNKLVNRRLKKEEIKQQSADIIYFKLPAFFTKNSYKQVTNNLLLTEEEKLIN